VAGALGLVPHTEGGYFRETYRAAEVIETPRGRRSLATSILCLVGRAEPSRFHRLASDEMWFFHAGGPLEMLFLDGPGTPVRSIVLDQGNPQVLAPAHVWMATRVTPGHAWTLLGCVVTPGFEYQDLQKAEREELLRDHPDAAGIIAILA
jgi:predicted cupin superfamily sugar epimerase